MLLLTVAFYTHLNKICPGFHHSAREMYSTNTGNTAGGFYRQQEHVGRGRQGAQEENQYIEGTLFGSSKVQGNFGAVDTSSRQNPSLNSGPPYYGGGGNAHRNGGYGDPQGAPQRTPFSRQNNGYGAQQDLAASAAGFGRWDDRDAAGHGYSFDNEWDQRAGRPGSEGWPSDMVGTSGSGGTGGGAGVAPLLLGNGGGIGGLSSEGGGAAGGIGAQDEHHDMPTVSLMDDEQAENK
ncbi:unnamed protein product, partial [Discosporangium mesarthrocarpum]